MDIWGEIYADQWAGRIEPHQIERDDGLVETFASAANYFVAPRSEGERELLDRLQGPVLDLCGGVGSYALYLQDRGIDVTVADSSPKAIEICRARGCADARVTDIRSLDLEPQSFGSVIIMGNTVGAHQTPETLPKTLATLRRAVKPGGYFLCSMIDPLATQDETHLKYHERNRERGLPPGLIRIRLKYKGYTDEWMYLWMPTAEEFARACTEAGWKLVEERSVGPMRVRILEAAG